MVIPRFPEKCGISHSTPRVLKRSWNIGQERTLGLLGWKDGIFTQFLLIFQKGTNNLNHNIRNEIKSVLVREGRTMDEVLMKLAVDYGWSRSVPNLSGKLGRGSLRYREAIELADALGYDLVWRKRS